MRKHRPVSSGYLILFVLIVLPGVLAGCSMNSQPATQPTAVLAVTQDRTPTPFRTREAVPATWTPTPLNMLPVTYNQRTMVPSPNFPQTLVAQTTVAAELHCKRHPDAWKVFTGPINAYAGWCLVSGTRDTLYEYKLLMPDGWIVNTFGELTPNLAFSTGLKNVQVKIFQDFSYDTIGYSGTLADAPETAAICDENKRCYGYISPHETLTRQETKTLFTREILTLDSTAGPLRIRRYYQIIPFNVLGHKSDRLFITEFSSLDSSMDEETYQKMLEKIEFMTASISQR
jgi:hypothetical protein